MELHQLRYVCAVAETGSFSRAAERCQIAQPSLSQQVLKLEEELGAKRFDRLGRGIRLTESGRAFLPHVPAILDQVDIARASVDSKNADLRGSVTLGAIPTIAPYLIPRYTAAFAKRFPDARLRIVEETTPVLIDAVPPGREIWGGQRVRFLVLLRLGWSRPAVPDRLDPTDVLPRGRAAQSDARSIAMA
jgi:LysR family transcriptional regulator, hydrogen peroxide-inducible genes activator